MGEGGGGSRAGRVTLLGGRGTKEQAGVKADDSFLEDHGVSPSSFFLAVAGRRVPFSSRPPFTANRV